MKRKKKTEDVSSNMKTIQNFEGKIGVATADKGINSFFSHSLINSNNSIYLELRRQIPIIDAAINKIVRLVGGFRFETGDKNVDDAINNFFDNINVCGNQRGIHSFVDNYLNQLLTYGCAIGEIISDENGIYALYNGEIDVIDVNRKKDSLCLEFFNTSVTPAQKIKDDSKILFSVINPEPESVYGVSLLRGLPFVSEILMKIYQTIETNWDRVGNLRYAVTYKPNGEDDIGAAQERASVMAHAWSDAMATKDRVKDFVAIGDVDIKVIGADSQILDSEIPVRQLLEQIVAKTGLMPYMFGLSWSTTEKMSEQQADILTTELECYRRAITPCLKQIGDTYLSIIGSFSETQVVWDDITLKDELELAQADYYRAQCEQIRKKEVN